MKKIILTSVFVCLCGSFAFSQGFYKLDFSDEFQGTSLDSTKWAYQIGTGDNGNFGWGNNEKQYYTRENTRVEGGYLIITGKRESKGGMSFTSSRLRTHSKYATTYGRIEARISLPVEPGMWPAFWMMPEKSIYGGWAASGEIDIMEAKGRLPNQYGGALHFGGGWPKNSFLTTGDYRFKNGETIEEFHVYAVEWKEGDIAWYCDGNLVGRHTAGWFSTAKEFPAPFDQDFHILLNLAIGGNFDRGVEPSTSWTSGEMKVDYVRVYKWSDTLTEPEVPTNGI